MWYAAALWALPAVLGARQSECPPPCTADPSKWTPYKTLESLKDCHHPVLLDISSHESPNVPEAPFRIHACTVEEHPDDPEAESKLFINLIEPSELAITDPDTASSLHELNFLLHHVQSVLADISNGDTRSVIGHFNFTTVGIYSGAAVDMSMATFILEAFRASEDTQTRKAAAIRVCGDRHDFEHTFAITVDTTGDMMTVRKAVDLWTEAHCVENETVLNFRDIGTIDKPIRIQPHPITKRSSKEDTCKMETVIQGDTCIAIAGRCGIPVEELLRYNSEHDQDGKNNDTWCTLLQPGDQLCCSERAKTPVSKPSRNKNGSCAAYVTEPGDTCALIAQKHALEESKISYFNDRRTWGWYGCDYIQPGLRICLSEGYPPLPDPRPDAACGPTVPGTVMPMDGQPLADLNPCPLNACCNILGNCGVSPEFCINEVGPTGNPGTAPADHKGCISNCGMEILENSDEPAEFLRIGYYASFNLDRPCLNLRAADIQVNDYTHIHWAFANINSSFKLDIIDPHEQWEDFLALDGVKRIVSFGGWGVTISTVFYEVLRKALDPANVDGFITNILEFVEQHNLDGVEFDWEYPGVSFLYTALTFAQPFQATDLQTVSFRSPSDGVNYLEFLKKLKKALPQEKDISVAAPASFWYLRGFPLAEIWQYVDYIIYMTYDFHGQWDYNEFVLQDWCNGGNCLRSHVTKAGVPKNKVAVGVASYGRAFGMKDADCTGPECKFEGPQSTALPGRCTRTPGIIANAEIEELILQGDINEFFYDAGSDSNILVYNDTQWVAFMSESTMRRRVEYYRSLRFAGYANWAVDLTHWSGDD
ncbi:hypothetical protein ASPVEDRAFT_54512 [Aspergillus versicolor CBS 583.65]|uniref:chitinase n=1 Tax=Aspergillus versicolor CBS 583.65 TaxID=1036611 RepID=A0A1L9PS86_ASPVE|nr:uncharacterized protein ASPVEDRAFT_54512 [Aspergillus versicolor CBS 583.65]OJJ04322.1 hypothetical protein ASPVEDRAFT_54512 [Aspergillus versicolor CBS 583.65]